MKNAKMTRIGHTFFKRVTRSHGVWKGLSIATAFIFMRFGVFAMNETVSEDLVLTNDWAVNGTLTVEEGVTVDLNGHTLTVRGIAGDGAIVCTSGDTGILCIDSDSNLTNDSVGLFGNLQLVKTGSGTFTAARKYQGYTGGTKINGGVFKYNSAGSFGQAGSANLVKNGDFESASISGKYAYTTGAEWSANPYWTCDGVNAGLDKGKNSNTMFESGIDVGTYAAYLRTGNNGTTDFGDGWFEQTITCFIPGIYRLGFVSIPPSLSARRGASVTVTLTDTVSNAGIFTFTYSAGYTAKTAIDVPMITIAKAGTYALRFSQKGSDKIQVTGFDDIVLEQVSDRNLIRNGTFDEADVGSPGSTVWATSPEWTANPYWTASGGDDSSYAGLIPNGAGGYIAPSTPVGKYAAVLRTTANGSEVYIRQAFSVAKPGIYQLRFSYIACYLYSNTRGSTVTANILHGDEVITVGSVVASDTGRTGFETTLVLPEAGDYILEFRQTPGNGTRITMLDDVILLPMVDVTVNESGTIDFSRTSLHADCQFILAGGMLYNPGPTVLKYLFLTADSTMSVINHSGMGADEGGAIIDLGGHNLSIGIPSGIFHRLFKTAILNGTITTSGAGTLYLGVDGGYVAATNLDLHAGCALNIINDVSLRDYKATYTGNSNSGSAEMTVSGTFVPKTDYFYGCTLLDGVTIDFTERMNTLNVVSSFTSGSNELSFAPYATIMVDLAGNGSRFLASAGNPYLIKWDTEPADVTFVLDEATRNNHFIIKPDQTGLQLIYVGGTVILIR